jgi:regulator of protease activity HflC (stomatin/prohibitin superfamily)
VIHTLEKQMEAERRKRAEITLASAEKAAMINLSQGERQEAINISEGQKQKRINEAKGTAQEIAIVANAQAQAMSLVAQALAADGGNEAMNMQLKEQFIEQIGQVIAQADIAVVPTELAKIEGFFAGMEQVADSVQGAKV